MQVSSSCDIRGIGDVIIAIMITTTTFITTTSTTTSTTTTTTSTTNTTTTASQITSFTSIIRKSGMISSRDLPKCYKNAQ
jgi:hypothetical protein